MADGDASQRLRAGWRFESMLCEADDVDTGAMWECPLLLELQQAPLQPRRTSVSGVGTLKSLMDSHTALGNGNNPRGGWPTTLDSMKEARNKVGGCMLFPTVLRRDTATVSAACCLMLSVQLSALRGHVAPTLAVE